MQSIENHSPWSGLVAGLNTQPCAHQAPKAKRNRINQRTGRGNAYRADSTSGRIRAALAASGPMTRAEICAIVGIKSNTVSSYMKNDMEKGRVLKIVRAGKLQRFALAEAT